MIGLKATGMKIEGGGGLADGLFGKVVEVSQRGFVPNCATGSSLLATT